MRAVIAALLVCTGLGLAVAPAAGARPFRDFGGWLVDDRSTSIDINFVGELGRKGQFIPTRVVLIRVGGDVYTCETPSHEVTTSRHQLDQPFSWIAPLRVNQRGRFRGQYKAGGALYQIAGSYHHGSPRGTILAYEGEPNVTTFCTTSLQRWTARRIWAD